MKFRLYISKFLLGLVAFIWTACTSDNGAGANAFAPASSSSGDLADSSSSQNESSSSQKIGLTRADFFNVDSLIAAAKQPKVITDSCVTARNYCETLTGENASGPYAANVLFEKRIDESPVRW